MNTHVYLTQNGQRRLAAGQGTPIKSPEEFKPGGHKFESLVGLHVVDEEGYRRYREAMTPILKTYGGRFRYDFVVAKALQSEAKHPINRVFVISFPDQDHKERFFFDPAYQAVRKTHFDPSVTGVTRIAEYNLDF